MLLEQYFQGDSILYTYKTQETFKVVMYCANTIVTTFISTYFSSRFRMQTIQQFALLTKGVWH